ncbi:hypothetical protein D3C76_508120 [compost metagenome]
MCNLRQVAWDDLNEGTTCDLVERTHFIQAQDALTTWPRVQRELRQEAFEHLRHYRLEAGALSFRLGVFVDLLWQTRESLTQLLATFGDVFVGVQVRSNVHRSIVADSPTDLSTDGPTGQLVLVDVHAFGHALHLRQRINGTLDHATDVVHDLLGVVLRPVRDRVKAFAQQTLASHLLEHLTATDLHRLRQCGVVADRLQYLRLLLAGFCHHIQQLLLSSKLAVVEFQHLLLVLGSDLVLIANHPSHAAVDCSQDLYGGLETYLVEGFVFQLISSVFISPLFICACLGLEDFSQLSDVVVFLFLPVLGGGFDRTVVSVFQCCVDTVSGLLGQNAVAHQLHGLTTKCFTATNQLRRVASHLIV